LTEEVESCPWLVFHGPLDGCWAAEIDDLLFDGTLDLSSGEQVHTAREVKVLLETVTLEQVLFSTFDVQKKNQFL